MRAVASLRYGCVAVNVWAGYAFAFGTTPWGAWPGAPPEDIQSGRGFVHNTRMLEGVEKTVITHPAIHPIKPAWFPSHRTLHRLGPPLVAVEGRRDLRRLPSVLLHALRG